MADIRRLAFAQALRLTTDGSKGAVITVGTIRNGQASYKVYGENAVELAPAPHVYEIGSITKTFTAALVCRAAQQNRLSLAEPVDRYLALPPPGNGAEYPSVRELLAHASGYRPFYYEKPMLSNFLAGRNSFRGVTRDMVLDKAARRIPRKGRRAGNFRYSNFGYALLGLVLEAVHRESYTALVSRLAQDELGLSETRVSAQDGNLGGCWEWGEGDAYLSAGGLTSTIADMLDYCRMLLARHDALRGCLEDLREIRGGRAQKRHKALGIGMDKIAMSWMFDEESKVFWHNGGTGGYNSYVGFSPERQAAAVVLANLPPAYRIPATILGIKRLEEI